MKAVKLTIIAAIAAVSLLNVSCGNSNKQEKETQAEETVVSTAMEVDEVLANADSLVNKEVEIEGVCAHICAHGGGKIFLMGSDDTKMIRVEAGELGSFKKECVNSIVNVKGVVVEQRIDEQTVLKMLENAKNQTGEKHGEGEEGGCSTSKKANNVQGNTVEEVAADYRAKIAARQEAEGKAYLSTYVIVAKSYEIK